MTARAGLAIALLLAVCLGTPARAVDGKIEINQTCATTTGCFTGDSAGFPVSIQDPGSYVLTSDLDITGNNWGIRVLNVPDVAIDLGGFTITGGGSGSPGRDGIQISNSPHADVSNGTIRGFSGRGLLAFSDSHGVRVTGVRFVGNDIHGLDLDGQGSLVKDCIALSNGLDGFAVESGLVVDSVADGNTSEGLAMGSEGGYARNVLTNNNGAGVEVTGGTPLGDNLCNTSLCP